MFMNICKAVILSLLLVTSHAHAAESPQLKGIELTQPPIDLEMVHRIWLILKKEIGARADTPYPPIVLDWEVPKIALMGTQYPTKEFPDNRLQISLAPRTLDQLDHQMLLFGIGHELTHYLFILRENEWDPSKKHYVVKRLHHCDAEFQRIMRLIIDTIWNTYHDDAMRNRLASEPRRSCVEHPEQ